MHPISWAKRNVKVDSLYQILVTILAEFGQTRSVKSNVFSLKGVQFCLYVHRERFFEQHQQILFIYIILAISVSLRVFFFFYF